MMENQGESKISDQLPLLSQQTPFDLRGSNADTNDATVGAAAGSSDSEVECSKTVARREELIREIGCAMETTLCVCECFELKQLEYLNSKNSASIFAAVEELTKSFSGIQEDLLRMEGLLVKKKDGLLGLEDMARARIAVANFHKLVIILTEPMDEEYIKELREVMTSDTAETSPYYKAFYPLASGFLDVYREVSQRTIKWTEEFCGRLSTQIIEESEDEESDEEL